jgi:hypothetical protein
MHQLISANIIDNDIIMINAQTDHGNSSIVKWGSWDQSALAEGE